jgi:hypothetical protein
MNTVIQLLWYALVYIASQILGIYIVEAFINWRESRHG